MNQSENKIKDILDTLSRNLRSKGTYGMAHLKNAFKELDTDGSNAITHVELRNGFRKSGFLLTEEEVDVIMKNFDRNGNGTIEYGEFVGGMNVVLA